MLPYFKIFSSFFMCKSGSKVKKNAKIAILGVVLVFTGCSFQQSAPKDVVTTTTETSSIEQAARVEFVNLSATNGEAKPSISNLLTVAYPKAEKLSLRGHTLETFDFALVKHMGATITYLDLAKCGLGTIPSEVSEAKSLTTLYLSDNRIGELGANIYQLDKLTYINLDRNSITNIQDGISQLKSLKWLRLNDNKLSSLPKDMAELKNIKRLYLSKNNFTEVPEVIKSMTSLEELNLGANRITEFPEWLCDMPNLKRIDLYGNPIKEIPDKVVDMPSLTTLVMDNCQLENDRKKNLNEKLADKRIKFIF